MLQLDHDDTDKNTLSWLSTQGFSPWYIPGILHLGWILMNPIETSFGLYVVNILLIMVNDDDYYMVNDG